MSLNENASQPALSDLLSAVDAENETIEFEPARLNLEARAAVEL